MTNPTSHRAAGSTTAGEDGTSDAMTSELAYQYGVRFRDGSVTHPWNGRTQRQRAEEELARLQVIYPGDDFILVRRYSPFAAWEEVTS